MNTEEESIGKILLLSYFTPFKAVLCTFQLKSDVIHVISFCFV